MHLDAKYYRQRAAKCREAAELATDEESRTHWNAAASRWLKLANQAEIVAGLLPDLGAIDNTVSRPCRKRRLWSFVLVSEALHDRRSLAALRWDEGEAP
jgi:hypothetical protein